MYLECFTSVKGVQKFQHEVLQHSYRFADGEDVVVAVDPAVLGIVKSVLGLLGAHVVLNNVDNKDHNDGQDGEYLSRVVEVQNVLP